MAEIVPMLIFKFEQTFPLNRPNGIFVYFTYERILLFNLINILLLNKSAWELMRALESWWECTRVDEGSKELMRVHESWWVLSRVDEFSRELMRDLEKWKECMRVVESAWELMRTLESWWECTRIDEGSRELMRMHESWWGLSRVDESAWGLTIKWEREFETSSNLIDSASACVLCVPSFLKHK